jgi:outer membrane protein OmpA-like peptidoglycan-associated protein
MIFIVAGCALVGCRAGAPVRSAGSSRASSPSASAVSAASAAPAFKVFPVYTEKGTRHSHYAPSGYMGDSDLTMSGAYTPTPHGNGPCLRVIYKGSGIKGWAGIYWQDPANNWGDVPGKAGYDLRGAKRLTFWARGEKGGERVHEFRIGGIVGRYPDSDVATLGNIHLTREWKQYTISLEKKDLRHIIAGFGFFVNRAENSGGATFYLDDIVFEGAQGWEALAGNSTDSAAPLSAPTTTQAVVAPPPPPPPPPAPVVPANQQDLQVKTVDSGLKVSFSSRLMFTPGQAVLEPGSGKVLDQLIALLNAYTTNRVLIEGHTDASGDRHFNLRLSELRAKGVRDYLIKHGGYDASRFQITGYGDTKPIAGNNTKAGRAMNRRVEVTILKTVNP